MGKAKSSKAKTANPKKKAAQTKAAGPFVAACGSLVAPEHGSSAECPRTQAPGIVCGRLYPDGDPNGKPCGAVSEPGADHCFHCKAAF